METIKTPGDTIYSKTLSNGLTFVRPSRSSENLWGLVYTLWLLDSRFRLKGSVSRCSHRRSGRYRPFLEHKLFEEEEGNVFGRFAEWRQSTPLRAITKRAIFLRPQKTGRAALHF